MSDDAVHQLPFWALFPLLILKACMAFTWLDIWHGVRALQRQRFGVGHYGSDTPGRLAELAATSCYLCTDMRYDKPYEVRCKDVENFNENNIRYNLASSICDLLIQDGLMDRFDQVVRNFPKNPTD
jgi:hypothetical protein